MGKFKQTLLASACLLQTLALGGCGGDDGKNGTNGQNGSNGLAALVNQTALAAGHDQCANGGVQIDVGTDTDANDTLDAAEISSTTYVCQSADGANGSNGIASLVLQTALSQGNSHCFNGGVRIDSGLDLNANSALDSGEIDSTQYVCKDAAASDKHFNRIATFPVCRQIDANCDTDEETAPEIVAASSDGMTLIYTDSLAGVVGFVDISDAAAPRPAGVLATAGEPTSVAVKGNYALVGVDTSDGDFVNAAGHLQVINVTTQTSVRIIDLGGQPDSVAISPDGNYAVIAIENQRDEDLDDGRPPQLPAGYVVIVNTSDADPANWSTQQVALTGVADLFPADPEPEFVDINSDNIAVVSLQENNHLVLIDLSTAGVIGDFSAGSTDLTLVDATEGAFPAIHQNENLDDVLREPDGVAWINGDYFVTADEGDMDGGSRGFTVFHRSGDVVWQAGNTLDHWTARIGHYPDERSANKGNEPENVEVAVFGSERLLFVNSERASVVFVYDVADPRHPKLKQVLPAATGPEGALAIPSRNLLIAASEEDSRGDVVRGSLNVYRYGFGAARYPTLVSEDRDNGSPIPWAAMSGLAADLLDDKRLYAVEDSFFTANRIFSIALKNDGPAVLEREIRISDSEGVLAGYTVAAVADGTAANDASRANVFDSLDLAAMINGDNSVNLDLEGIAAASDGGFWLASEGAGTVNEAARPVNSANLILKTDAQGVIEEVIGLPAEVNALQVRFGFEGVAEWNDNLVVAFQRAWGGEANPRIGIYDRSDESWRFVFYPLNAVASQNGGWVGLSDITYMGEGVFMVVERDNQGGPDAAIKRLYTFDLDGVADGATVSKTLLRDLMADLAAPGGLIPEKVEGSALTRSGDIYIVNDNDGVDGVSGETQLLRLGKLPAAPELL